jgi:hypothetical protein
MVIPASLHCTRALVCYGDAVSIQEIKQELEVLPADERRELAAFLVSLRHKDLDGYRARMAAKIDDPSEEKWVTLEELDRRLES